MEYLSSTLALAISILASVASLSSTSLGAAIGSGEISPTFSSYFSGETAVIRMAYIKAKVKIPISMSQASFLELLLKSRTFFLGLSPLKAG